MKRIIQGLSILTFLVVIGAISLFYDFPPYMSGDAEDYIKSHFENKHQTSNNYRHYSGFGQGGRGFFRFNAHPEDIQAYIERGKLTEVTVTSLNPDPRKVFLEAGPMYWWRPKISKETKFYRENESWLPKLSWNKDTNLVYIHWLDSD
jgi:uncharacterized protein YxeA